MKSPNSADSIDEPMRVGLANSPHQVPNSNSAAGHLFASYSCGTRILVPPPMRELSHSQKAKASEARTPRMGVKASPGGKVSEDQWSGWRYVSLAKQSSRKS